MKFFFDKDNHMTRNSGLIYLTMILLAGLITVGGCAQNDSPPPTFSESQAMADEEWIKGADRPPTPRTLLALSRVYVSQGREKEAQFVLHKVTKDYPYYPEAYVELAELHMRHRRVDMAIKILSEGLVNLPNDHVITNDIGMCYLIRRNNKVAMDMFSAAAALAPNNTRYRSNIALVLGLEGRYEESLAAYKQITNNIEAHFNLAVICDARKDHARANEERKKAEMYKARAAEAAAIVSGEKVAEK